MIYKGFTEHALNRKKTEDFMPAVFCFREALLVDNLIERRCLVFSCEFLYIEDSDLQGSLTEGDLYDIVFLYLV